MHRDQLRIQDPCHADWSAMTGDRARRHCASCDKHVHDLSAMTERDAARLLASGRELCVRYAARPDGTVIHAAPARRLPRLLAVAGALVAAAPALASSAPRTIPEATEPAGPTLVQRLRQRLLEAVGAAEQIVSVEPVEMVMGEMPPPPPPVMGQMVAPQPLMGKVAAPPTIQLPPAPPPTPSTPVIPEVEEASR